MVMLRRQGCSALPFTHRGRIGKKGLDAKTSTKSKDPHICAGGLVGWWAGRLWQQDVLQLLERQRELH